MTDFESLHFSARAMGALRQLRVTSAAELLDVQEADVRSLRNAGGKTWREIAEAQSRVLREMAVARIDLNGASPSSGSAGQPAFAEPDLPDLRDSIAIRVLAGIVTGLWTNPDMGAITPEAMADEAYQCADAMLNARAKGGA
ncbi:MAG: DNA-directed RNA polymerase subunit alpha C-terminal domain-containing protein [Pelagibaca sp.]